MLDLVIGIIIGLILIIPLLISIPYLLKAVIDSKKKDKIGKFFIKTLSCVILFFIVVFLIFMISISFIFTQSQVEIPPLLRAVGMVFFCLYYFIGFGFFYSLGFLGHGGISPSNVVWDLYHELFRNKKNTK